MKDIIYRILWSAIEDYVGLWEIKWEFNSILSANGKESTESIKRILQYFLENGLVKFYYNKWGSNEVQEIENDEAFKLLNEEKYWEAPEMNNTCLKVGSTEKGEKFYNENLILNDVF